MILVHVGSMFIMVVACDFTDMGVCFRLCVSCLGSCCCLLLCWASLVLLIAFSAWHRQPGCQPGVFRDTCPLRNFNTLNLEIVDGWAGKTEKIVWRGTKVTSGNQMIMSTQSSDK